MKIAISVFIVVMLMGLDVYLISWARNEKLVAQNEIQKLQEKIQSLETAETACKEQTSLSENQTEVVADSQPESDFPPGGAIKKVLDQKQALDEIRKEAWKFGIIYRDYKADRINNFIQRAKVNSKLAFALKQAFGNGIWIFLEERFSVESSWLEINDKSPDDKIIKFLMG